MMSQATCITSLAAEGKFAYGNFKLEELEYVAAIRGLLSHVCASL